MISSFLQLFFLRLLDMSMNTVRFMMTMRGRRALAWIFAFIGSLAYVIGVRSVLTDMSNWAKILGYSTGFACGMLLGMWLEERLGVGYTQVKIISPGLGSAIVERLRAEGYAVTEIPARGRDSSVDCLICSTPRRRANMLLRLVMDCDEEAFITTQDVQPLQHGYWPH